MLQQRPLVEVIAERIGPDSFHDPRLRSIFSTLLQLGENATMDELAASLDPDSIEFVQGALQQQGAIVDVERTINDSIAKIQNREIENQIAELTRLLAVASETERAQIEEQRRELRSQKRALGKGSYAAVNQYKSR
jgi:hypothetical protein